MNRATIERYLKNQCNEDEIAVIRQWIEQHGEQWYDHYFEHDYEDEQRPVSESSANDVFLKVLRRIRTAEQQQIQDDTATEKMLPVKRGYSLRHSWIAAACLILVAGTAWLSIQQAKNRWGQNVKEQTWVKVYNGGTSAKEILLPDSSKVVLNIGSAIRYQQVFRQMERTVELSGEAFFDVTHNSEKPFVVKAGKTSTIVYGTAFNVQAYPGESRIIIALQRGKIGIRYSDNTSVGYEKILVPGQQYQYDQVSRSGNISPIPTEQVNGWIRGGLFFYNSPLKDVFTQLERKFGVHFSFNATVPLQNTFTAQFQKASLVQVLTHLSFTSDLNFSQQGDTIYVK